MPAPKGNKFWEARATHGREKTFSNPVAVWESCVEYFAWCHDNPLEEAIVYQGELNDDQAKPLMRAMTLEGLFLFLEIDDETWRNYRQAEGYEEYFGIVKRVEYVIRTQKFQGAAAGLLNPNIIARDLGLKEASQHEHTSPDGSMTPTIIERVIVDPQATD
jgi:hypothetical protein